LGAIRHGCLSPTRSWSSWSLLSLLVADFCLTDENNNTKTQKRDKQERQSTGTCPMTETLLKAQHTASDIDDTQSSDDFHFEHPLFARIKEDKASSTHASESLGTAIHAPVAPQTVPSTPHASRIAELRQSLHIRKPLNDIPNMHTPGPSKEQTTRITGSTARWKKVGHIGLGPPRRERLSIAETMPPLMQVDDQVDTSRSGKSSFEVSVVIKSEDSIRSTEIVGAGVDTCGAQERSQDMQDPQTINQAQLPVPVERLPLFGQPQSRPSDVIATPKHSTPPTTGVFPSTATAVKSVKFNFGESAAPTSRAVASHAQPPPTMALDAPLPVAARKPKSLVRIVMNGREYTRLDQIGKGGSSKVFRVMAPSGRIFALKRVDFEQADRTTIQGYKSEIELLRRMATSSGAERIIKLYDSEIDDTKGRLMMLMEAGEIDLAHMLNKQADSTPDFNFIRLYWRHMLEAVQAVHDQHIVHSDLKPANFLLVEGCLKLIDFGIAKAIGNDTTNIHRDQQVGTVNYMSPEALSDTGGSGARLMKLGRASDVWSLGCILYQMVYGRTPFAHLTMIQKIQAIPNPAHRIDFPTRAYPPAMANKDSKDESLARTVDGDLLRVMRGCLERDAKQRLTIAELLKDSFLRPEDKVARAAQPDHVGVGLLELTELLRLTVSQTREKTLGKVAIADADIQMLAKDFYDHLRLAR
jgi:serine/threonine-protein kinase TTK/MPS1